ncbi:MAG: sensor histidine kinase [Ignavibacteriaceae bacterium]|nr:sensor histidine kinase [Ignavibacteriaceae bacterium]
MRYWQILCIEDEATELINDIRTKVYWNPRGALNNMCSIVGDNIAYSDTTFTDKWFSGINEPEDCIPLVYNSLSSAYEGLKKINDDKCAPDIIFLDVRLVKNEQNILIIDEMINYYKSAIKYSYPELDQHIHKSLSINDEGRHILFERAGLFLLPLIRNTFPKSELIVYTESIRIFNETLPFQALGIFFVPPSGKFLVENSNSFSWITIFNKKRIESIDNDEVDANIILNLIDEYEKKVQTIIKDNNLCDAHVFDEETLNILKEYNAYIINSKIGKTNPGWSFGSFFTLELQALCSVSIADKFDLINNIRSLIYSIDKAKVFCDLITNCNTSLFYNITHNGPLTPDKTGEEDYYNRIIKQYNEHKLNEDIACRYLFDKIINTSKYSETKYNCDKYKNHIRIGAYRLKDYVNNIVINNVDNDIEISVEDVINDSHRELVLPVHNGDINMIIYLIKEIITNTIQRGFDQHQEKKKIVIKMIAPESGSWQILIKDNGIGFDRSKLKNPTYFKSKNHGMREVFNMCRGWISINIQANDGNNGSACYMRNPHSDYYIEYNDNNYHLFNDLIMHEQGTLFDIRINIYHE